MGVRVLAIALVVLTVAGCSLLPPPAGIQLTIPAGGEGIPALPVTVVDHAGIVAGAAPGAPANDAGMETVVLAVPGRPDQLSVHWIGGACDDRAILTIDAAATGYTLRLESPSSASGCNAMGIFRTVILDTTQPVNADDVAVR